MLGSGYFVRNLPVPRGSILANINLELTNVFGPTEDVYAIGARHSELDGTCRQAARNLGLDYIPEEGGMDGFSSVRISSALRAPVSPECGSTRGIVHRGTTRASSFANAWNTKRSTTIESATRCNRTGTCAEPCRWPAGPPRSSACWTTPGSCPASKRPAPFAGHRDPPAPAANNPQLSLQVDPKCADTR